MRKKRLQPIIKVREDDQLLWVLSNPDSLPEALTAWIKTRDPEPQ